MERLNFAHELEPATLLDQLMQPTPEVVVVSGGPCAGKTTLLEQLPDAAEAAGRTLTIMPEVATRLMQEGVDFVHLATHDRPAYLDAQRQIIQEELDFVASALRKHAGTNALVVLDRGVSDTFGYMTSHEAALLASEYGKTPHELGYDSADRVVYLPSLAASDPSAYERLKTTNATRYETAGQAMATCDRTLRQWAHHPQLYLAEDRSFSQKLQRATQFCLANGTEFEQEWELTQSDAEALIAAKTESNEIISLTQLLQRHGVIDGQSFRLQRGLKAQGYTFFNFLVRQPSSHGSNDVYRALSQHHYEQLSGFAPKIVTKLRYTFRHHSQLLHADYITSPSRHHGRWFLEAEAASSTAHLPVASAALQAVCFPNPDLVQ